MADTQAQPPPASVEAPSPAPAPAASVEGGAAAAPPATPEKDQPGSVVAQAIGSSPVPELTPDRESLLDDSGEPAAADAADASAGGGGEADDGSGTTKQTMVYNVSLTYNKLLSLPTGWFAQGGRPWWTPLKLPDGTTIVLGALPLKTEGHLETLTTATIAANGFNKVGAVLTLNKQYELEPSLMSTPVSAADWSACDPPVTQKIFPVEDFHRPSPERESPSSRPPHPIPFERSRALSPARFCSCYPRACPLTVASGCSCAQSSTRRALSSTSMRKGRILPCTFTARRGGAAAAASSAAGWCTVG